MKKVLKFVANGKNYISIDEKFSKSCSGCVFFTSLSRCSVESIHNAGECANNKSIFKECDGQQSFTVREVLEFANKHQCAPDHYYPEEIDQISADFYKQQAFKNDPEYKEFLRLQEKFV